jgi:hypothetical protein
VEVSAVVEVDGAGAANVIRRLGLRLNIWHWASRFRL